MPPSQFPLKAPSIPVVGRPSRARNAPLFTGLLCAALFGLLGALGQARPAWAAALAGLSVLAGFVFAWRAERSPLDSSPGDAATMQAPTPAPQEAQTYVLALELAPNPVLLVSGEDPDDIAARRILFANAEARELLRIGRDGALLVAAVRNPAVLEAIDEALFGSVSRQLSYESGGAQTRYWRVWTKPLPPNGLHQRLALVILRDETDARLNERMRADFLANASHELRTPLASLTGFIETLRGHARDDPEARDRFLLIMSRQAERMARLIDDLLSLSRIELSEHIRPSGTCELAAAINDVLDALSPLMSAKGVRVVLDLAAGSSEVVGDRDQIVQVVQNLLDNAVKYAPPGGVVAVSLATQLSLEQAGASRSSEVRATAANGGRMPLLTPVRQLAERYALVRIDDSGPGMAREHLPRLTERFYRVEGQRSGERMGTGLGLAIVKHIVNRHRGGFFVESAPSQGASFGVYFPMTSKSAGDVEASSKEPVKPDTAQGARAA